MSMLFEKKINELPQSCFAKFSLSFLRSSVGTQQRPLLRSLNANNVSLWYASWYELPQSCFAKLHSFFFLFQKPPTRPSFTNLCLIMEYLKNRLSLRGAPSSQTTKQSANCPERLEIRIGISHPNKTG